MLMAALAKQLTLTHSVIGMQMYGSCIENQCDVHRLGIEGLKTVKTVPRISKDRCQVENVSQKSNVIC